MTLTTPKRCLLSTLVLLLLTFFSMVSAHEQSSDNYTMFKNVLSNGGNKSNSPNYQLVATLGQNATQKSTANGNVLYSGFYAPMGTQQPIISGTVLNEDTDAGLKDWTVKLEPIANGDIITTLTDANGEYKFEDSYSPMIYLLYVAPKDGWEHTFPTNDLGNYTINLEETQVFENMDFRYDSEAKIGIQNGYFCITGESNGVGYSWRLDEESNTPSCVKKVNGEDVPITCQNSDAKGIDAGQNSIELATDFTVEIMKASQYGIIPNKYNDDHRCFTLPVKGTLCVASKDTVINDCDDENACKIGDDGCTYNPTIRWVESSPDAILSVAQTSHNVVGTNGTVTFDVANAGAGSMGWIVEEKDSWLTIESGDYGKNNGTITVHYDANSDEERVGTITVVAPGIENGSQVLEIKTSENNLETGDYSTLGIINNKAGNPIVGVSVKVGEKTSVTDDTGNWEISNLKEGEYTITASKEGYTFEPAQVNLTGDETSQQVTIVVLTEPVSYRASGTIKDKEGNPLPDVTIQIGDDKTTTTDTTGSWEINGLAEGEYTVIASKAGYQFDSKPCVVSDNVKVCQPAIKGEPLLDVKVVPEPRIAKQAENVIYTITVTNQGEETATFVTLADVLPDNTNLVSIESLDGGSCQAETITCNLPDLTPGATANVKVVVSNSQAKTLINTVTVNTQEYPTDVKKTWTRVIPYLSVSVTDLPDPIEMLKVLHYSVAVELSHYAPTDATDVTLVSQLPIGVELKSLNSDYALCDSSAFPKITCQFNDLSIASPDSVSQATVEMEVELKDAGLLLLTHEAKVTANEYPAHLVRERTTIFIPDGIQVDLALVIDVTGSMQEEINGVIKALKTFIAEMDTRTAPLMALLTFGDDVKVAAFTRDMAVLRGAIENLTASGGGLCEEASVEALLVAIPHTKAGGDILFATDASPYDDADVEKVMTLLRGKGIRFNAMITGDCSKQDSWNNLP